MSQVTCSSDDDDAVRNAVLSLLTCPLCTNPFVSPVANQTCGHTFCESCINTAIERGCYPVGQRDGLQAPQRRRRKITFQCPVCLLPAFKWTLVRLDCVASFARAFSSGLKTFAPPAAAASSPLNIAAKPAVESEEEKEEGTALVEPGEEAPASWKESSPLFPESLPLFAPLASDEAHESLPAPMAIPASSCHTLASFVITPPPSPVAPPHELQAGGNVGLGLSGHFVSPVQIRGPTDEKMRKLLLDEPFAGQSEEALAALKLVRLATKNLGGMVCNPPKNPSSRCSYAELSPMVPTHCVVITSTDTVPALSVAVCEALARNQQRQSDADPAVWVVTIGWVEASCRSGQWVDPQPYEVTSTSSARGLLRLVRLNPRYVQPPCTSIFATRTVLVVAADEDDCEHMRALAAVRLAKASGAGEALLLSQTAVPAFKLAERTAYVAVARTEQAMEAIKGLAALAQPGQVTCLGLEEVVAAALDGRAVAPDKFPASYRPTAPAAAAGGFGDHTRRPLLYS